MAIYLLKKSYQHKDLLEVSFKDLWGDKGIFTTMWIFGKPPKILFFENHIQNFIKSLEVYGIKKRFLKKYIFKIINKNLSKTKSYNHLLRIASNKKIISISLRKRLSPKLDFDLKLINLKREKPEFKNLKYKKILSHLVRMDNSKSDIGLVYKKKILETGTSNLLFIKDKKVFIPMRDYYEGNTLKFFKTKIKKMIKKDIFIKELNIYDEIILVGSGKGVASVKTIKQIGWKRKSLKQFKMFSKSYHSAIKNCSLYKF
jgi:4-amino-4-deoxychorismate lyase